MVASKGILPPVVLIVGPLIVPSAEQPNKKPIQTQIIRKETDLNDNEFRKLLIVNILVPPEFNFYLATDPHGQTQTTFFRV
jgi:hypothetical protein